MRKFFLACFVMTAALALAASGFALEKTQIRDDAGPAEGWNSAATCAIVYYNRCTLWSWVWSNWSPGDRIGVSVSESCCDGAHKLAQTALRVFGSAPTMGYGFTGTASVYPVDANGCPIFSTPLESQPWFPGTVVACYLDGGPPQLYDFHSWSAPGTPAKFAVVYEFGTAGGGGTATACGAAIGTDHPAAGPTGPAACGFCYPTTRVSHSFYYGNPTTTLCPGSTFFDGVCDAELRLDIWMECLIAVEPQSWGSVKNLYR
jgi:hypothetical protein